MIKFKHILMALAATALLLSVGCKNVQVSEKTSTVLKDSVNYKEITVIKDSLVYTDVDSAAIKALVICPDGKPLDIKPTIAKGNKQATAVFEIKNGVASVKCLCDSVGIIAQYKSTHKTEFKGQLNSIESKIKEVVEVKVYPWWLKILGWIGGASVAYLIFRIVKLFI